MGFPHIRKALLNALLHLDERASARLVPPSEAQGLRFLAVLVAHSGDSPLWALAAGISLIWGSPPWRDFGWRVLIGTLATGALTTILKWVFRRQRPPGDGIGYYSRFDRHAFPSGHAGRTACLVVLLGPLVAPWGWPLLCLWAGLVGAARVSLEVHFASDILGGWTVGLLAGILLSQAL